MEVITINRFTAICLILCFLFSLFGCASIKENQAPSIAQNEPELSATIPTQTSKPESSQVADNRSNSIDSMSSKYFTDIMPPLTEEEKTIVNLPVPNEIRDEFESFLCFPHDELGEVFTYGDLWRYIGEDGSLTINGSVALKRTTEGTLELDCPSILPYLKSIKRLAFQPYHIKFPISDIGKMTWLEELAFGMGSLDYPEMPDSFFNLINLKSLSFSMVGAEELPDKFDVFGNLEVLYLSYGFIEYLPPSIFKLSNLKILDISNNDISELPKGISELTNLEVLELVGNPLTSIPNEICELTNLEILSLGELTDKYKYADEDLYSHYLKKREVSKLATSLPDDFGNLTELKELEIIKFPITKLPDSFGNLINLEKLRLSLPLETLPNSFANLSNLNDISIYNDNDDDSNRLRVLAQELLDSKS